MMSALSHPLITDYLDRLHTESGRLPADQGRELLADIHEHFASALGEDPSEAQIRETIDRLGAPAELVDAAGGAIPGAGPRPTAAAGTSGREGVAAVLLVASAVFFVVWFISLPMWVAGIVMVALARRWTVGEKVLALASWGTLLPFAWVATGYAGFVAFECSGQECTPPPGHAALLTGSAIVAVLYLAFVAWASWRLVRTSRR